MGRLTKVMRDVIHFGPEETLVLGNKAYSPQRDFKVIIERGTAFRPDNSAVVIHQTYPNPIVHIAFGFHKFAEVPTSKTDVVYIHKNLETERYTVYLPHTATKFTKRNLSECFTMPHPLNPLNQR